MNSDTRVTAEQIAKDTGALVQCEICGNSYIRVFNREAEQQAYTRATDDWKSGVRGFEGMQREDVTEVVKSVLDNANLRCPNCELE